MVTKNNGFLSSFSSATKGIGYVFHSERNFKIQSIFALLAIFCSFIFPLQRSEQLLIFVSVFSVLIMEICNTAVEKFSDLLKPRLHSYVKDVKNMMAGAVLLTSLLSVIIGLYIFVPYIFLLVY